jgi:hypothetical protein
MSVKNSAAENTPSVKQEYKDKGSDDHDFQKKMPLIALIVSVVSIVISMLTVSFRQVCVTGCGLWCYNLPSL